jgi:co-chaperonin GroES (HSP10)
VAKSYYKKRMGMCESSLLRSLSLIGSRVLIERIAAALPPTQSGIVIPENSAQPAPTRGRVLSVGSKCRQIREGDTVTYEYGCRPVFEDGDCVIMEEADLLLEIAVVDLAG